MITKRLLGIVLITLMLFFFSSMGFAADMDPAKAAPPAKADLTDTNTVTNDQSKGLEGLRNAYSQKINDVKPQAKQDQLKLNNMVPAARSGKIKGKGINTQAPKDNSNVKQRVGKKGESADLEDD